MPLTDEHDYSSPAGQKHIHQNCICAIPGIIKGLDKIESNTDATSLVHRLLKCTNDYALIDKIIQTHCQRFLPDLLDYLSWEDR